MDTTTSTASSVQSQTRADFWDRRGLARTVTVLALLTTATYLTWRVIDTSAGVSKGLFIPLLVAEFVAFARLALETRVTWTVPPMSRPDITSTASVDIVVTTYHEPSHVVRATLLGCRAVSYPHETWLVDDSGRVEMEALAKEFGCHYLYRRDRTGARAGALNHALEQCGAELVLLLDADQVPLPDALHATVGYFSDDQIAIVQTPLEYLNRDSVLHSRNDRHERSVENEVYGPARDHLGAAVWSGSASLVRRTAMLSIGKISTESTTGDLQTSVRLHSAGWTTRFHAETVVQGLAPHNLALFLSQRERWARGHIGILRTRDNPLLARGLSSNQRIAYAHIMVQYLQPVADLTMLAMLAASLWTGEQLLSTSLWELALFWAPAFAFRSMAWVALSRGRLAYREAAARRMLNLEIHLKAVLAGLARNKRRFVPVQRTGVDEGGLDVIEQLRLLTVLTVGLEIVLGVRMLDALIGWPLNPMEGLALVATCTAAATVLWLSLQVLGVFVRRRQYRSHYRVNVNLGGYANGALVKVRNLTPAGVGLVSTTPIQPGTTVIIRVRVPDARGGASDLELKAITRNLVPNQHGTRYRVGCRFIGLSIDQLNLITEYASVVRPFQLLRG